MIFKRIDIIFLLLVLALFSASWDIFMQIKVGGFSLRFTQFIIMLLMFLGTLHTLSKGKNIIPLGFGSLLLWACCIFAFVPHTTFLPRSILYALWLLFCIMSVYIFVQLIHSEKRLETIMRWYIYSFTFVSAFGLLQFAAGLLGKNLLTMQWYIPGRFPRINGFSYEPSFFAIYMVQGFILTAYLREKKTRIMPRRIINLCYLTIAFSLLVSTSRAGWIICYLWFSRPLFIFLWHLTKGNFSIYYFKKTCLKVFFPTLCLIILGTILVKIFSINFFISGISFLGGGSHSSGTRWNSFVDLITIFINSPFIGYSLGGLSSAIGALHGVIVTNNEQAKDFEGTGVALEILAASGLLGVIPFLSYIYQILIKPWQMAKRLPDSETKKILIGLVVSLFFTLIIVQSGQNILRTYIWYHIALISSAYATGKRLSIEATQQEDAHASQNSLANSV